MTETAEPVHLPVLLEETLAALDVRPAGTYVDGTYGRGGHASAVLERLGPEGTLVVVDRDKQAIEHASQTLGSDLRVRIHHGTFDSIRDLLGDGVADGILLDLGVSSPQLDEPARGFSFMRDGPLDMRMDQTCGQSAAEFLAHAGEAEIGTVIATYGEERFARRIARSIVAQRDVAPLLTTGQLADLVSAAIPARLREAGKHPATRTFQALRIHLNRELDQLDRALDAALEVLRVRGRLAVISFHSLEDRRVKRFMRHHADGDPVWRGLPNIPVSAQPRVRLVGKAQHAGADEVERNPRSRSAVLRVAEKVRP